VSTTPTPAATATAALYLRMLSSDAPRGTLLDVRYRIRGGSGLARFFLDIHGADAATTLVRIGQQTDVYVGAAPRKRRSGKREDIAPTPLLWADCDGPGAVATLLAFPCPPTAIVRTGSGSAEIGNAHAYWSLTHCLSIDELEHTNRRLAALLGADPQCVDATRILRVPATRNFKHDPPRPVQLHEYTGRRYRPVEIFTALPAIPAERGGSNPTPQQHRRAHHRYANRADDPLLEITPAHYVTRLTGRTPGRDGKILCPLHQEKTPSFHVYPTPEQGWTCFGCPITNGKRRGGDIYTLASLLWDIPTHGDDFSVLRARLDELFGVRRTPVSRSPDARRDVLDCLRR
jgi:hypothetical protein